MKFGGTSVEDAEAFGRVAGIVCGRREAAPVVVVSAMSGMTDALFDAFATAQSGGEAVRAWQTLGEHFARHERVAAELLSRAEADAFPATLARAGDHVESLHV